jgi:hypothetical protein
MTCFFPEEQKRLKLHHLSGRKKILSENVPQDYKSPTLVLEAK